jgi:hypothetical protein
MRTVGQELTVTYPLQQPVRWPVHFASSQMVYFGELATADLGSLAKLGRQCAGYLPFSR